MVPHFSDRFDGWESGIKSPKLLVGVMTIGSKEVGGDFES